VSGIYPNIISFNTLLSKSPKWDDSLWVWNQMEASGIRLDIISFSTLLYKSPTWEDSLHVWEQMEVSGIYPNIISFNTLLSKSPSWEVSLQVWEKMEATGIQPDLITLNTLVGAASDTYRQCLELLDRFAAYKAFAPAQSRFDRLGILPIQRASWQLWHYGLSESHAEAVAFFQARRPKSSADQWQEFYLLLLMIKRQRQACLALFEASPYQLKEVFKPLYYALLKIWGPDKALEMLRMPPEIEGTVDEVVAFVREMQEKYRT
jgi:hypothetical protein